MREPLRKILSADGILSTLAGGGGGNLYVCDYGNYAIRKITPGGQVATVAGGNGDVDAAGTLAAFSSLGGIAVASAGDLLVADAGNQVLRRVPVSSASDTIYGVAPNALFSLGAIGQSAPWQPGPQRSRPPEVSPSLTREGRANQDASATRHLARGRSLRSQTWKPQGSRLIPSFCRIFALASSTLPAATGPYSMK